MGARHALMAGKKKVLELSAKILILMLMRKLLHVIGCKIIGLIRWAIGKTPGLLVYIVFATIGVIVGYGLAATLFTKNEFHVIWFAGWIIGLSAVIWPFARIEKSVFEEDSWSHDRIRKILKLFFLSIVTFSLAVLFLAAHLSFTTDSLLFIEPIGRQISSFYGLLGDMPTVYIFAILSAAHIVFFLFILYQVFLLSLPKKARDAYIKGMKIGLLPKF